MLYSMGKDSAVMLHLARKAFYPAPPPFPLLHVDTGWKFRAMYEMRDKVAAAAGMEMIVHRNPEAMAKGINPFDHGSLHTDLWKTEGLKQALDKHGFDVAFGAARRNEEKSRAKERIFSFRELGGFILVDRISNATAGAGMIHFALRRAHNIHWQHLEVDRNAHAALKRQRSRVVWFTGLSGAGKSTIANLVEKKLHHLGRHTFLLDGDNLRHGLNRDLGFSDADRVENIRRAGEVARLMADAGLIVLCAFISPFRAERRMVRSLMEEGEFLEVFVDVPLADAEQRDPKGLYRKARAGDLPNFTGIGSPYEVPEDAEIRIDTTTMAPEEAAELIVKAVLG
jgi:adenylyl-sulfate kinase